MNPNELFVGITGAIIYEFNMKKLAEGLVVKINSCSRIHSQTLAHTHTYTHTHTIHNRHGHIVHTSAVRGTLDSLAVCSFYVSKM